MKEYFQKPEIKKKHAEYELERRKRPEVKKYHDEYAKRNRKRLSEFAAEYLRKNRDKINARRRELYKIKKESKNEN